MSESDLISLPQALLNLIISMGAVLLMLLGIFRWKLNQALKSQRFNSNSKTDMGKLEGLISNLCNQVKELEKRIDLEIIHAKEEHAEFQIKLHEVMKEFYQLVGEFKGMKEFGSK